MLQDIHECIYALRVCACVFVCVMRENNILIIHSKYTHTVHKTYEEKQVNEN